MTTAVQFHGGDLVISFHNGAGILPAYFLIEYECANSVVTHRIDQAAYQSVDTNGIQHYTDTLTFSENQSAGLTRTPTVTLYAFAPNGDQSAPSVIPLENDAPVLPAPPNILSTLEGITVEVTAPVDIDISGYVAWVGDTKTFALNDASKRYQGQATTFNIPLGDWDTHYVCVAAYDTFGVDTSVAWSALEAIRSYNVASTANALSVLLQKSIDDDIEAMMQGTVSNHLTTWSNQADAQSQINNISTSLTVLDNTITDVVQTAITTLDAQIADANSNITSEQQARANADATLTSNLNTQTSRLDNFGGVQGQTLESSYSSLSETVVANNTAQTIAYQTLTASLSDLDTSIQGQIVTINKTITDGTAAQASSLNSLTSRFNNFGGSGNTIESTITNINSAISTASATSASSLSAVQTNLNGQIAGVAAQMTSVQTAQNGILNTYTVKLDGNGYASGFGLINGTNQTSSFVINADYFQIIKPGGGASTTFYNGAWKVFDSAGVLRVQMGNLSA